MVRAFAIALLLPLPVLAQCPWENQLRQFIGQNPVALAREAISRNDLRFLGVAGFAVIVPGVDTEKCVARPEAVYVIEGTSDVVCDTALQETATEFARTYNLMIKAQLDARQVKYEACAL